MFYRSPSVQTLLNPFWDTSAGTGKLCILGHLEITRNAKLVAAVRDDNKLPFLFPKKIYLVSILRNTLLYFGEPPRCVET